MAAQTPPTTVERPIEQGVLNATTPDRYLENYDWDTASIASTIRPRDWDTLSTASTLIGYDVAPPRSSSTSISQPRDAPSRLLKEYTLRLTSPKGGSIIISSDTGVALYTSAIHKWAKGPDITLHPGGDSTSFAIAAARRRRTNNAFRICLPDTSSPQSTTTTTTTTTATDRGKNSAKLWEEVEAQFGYSAYRFYLPLASPTVRRESVASNNTSTSTSNSSSNLTNSNSTNNGKRFLVWTRNTATLKLSAPRHYALVDVSTSAVLAILDSAWEDQSRPGKLTWYGELLNPEQEITVLIVLVTILAKMGAVRKDRHGHLLLTGGSTLVRC